MENKDKQHLQAPKTVMKNINLSLNDIAVYLKIGLYMNKDHVAFPSLQTIAENTKLSIPTVRKCISHLEEAKAIKVEKVGKLNHYIFFQDHEMFERYGHKFLNNKDLTAQEIAFVAKMQPNMFINDNVGKVKYSNSELAKLTGISISTIKRYQTILFNKGFVDISGNEKTYFLDELGQFVICTLKDHEDRLTSVEHRMTDMENKLSQFIKLQTNKQEIIL